METQPLLSLFQTFQGVGSGTMSERQKQYDQLRVTQATDRIYKYRMKKLMPEGENSMIEKEKRAARTRKIRYCDTSKQGF